MSWSGSTLVQSSAGNIACGSGATTRWGDYSGTAKRYNLSWPSVWMSGAYGDASNTWDTWIAEIHGPGAAVQSVKETQSNAKVYPNPVYENFNVTFSLKENTDLNISIVAADGRLVKDLYSGRAFAGDNEFSFNKANLSDGVYILRIRTGAEIIRDEKFIVAH